MEFICPGLDRKLQSAHFPLPLSHISSNGEIKNAFTEFRETDTTHSYHRFSANLYVDSGAIKPGSTCVTDLPLNCWCCQAWFKRPTVLPFSTAYFHMYTTLHFFSILVLLTFCDSCSELIVCQWRSCLKSTKLPFHNTTTTAQLAVSQLGRVYPGGILSLLCLTM